MKVLIEFLGSWQAQAICIAINLPLALTGHAGNTVVMAFNAFVMGYVLAGDRA